MNGSRSNAERGFGGFCGARARSRRSRELESLTSAVQVYSYIENIGIITTASDDDDDDNSKSNNNNNSHNKKLIITPMNAAATTQLSASPFAQLSDPNSMRRHSELTT